MQHRPRRADIHAMTTDNTLLGMRHRYRRAGTLLCQDAVGTDLRALAAMDANRLINRNIRIFRYWFAQR